MNHCSVPHQKICPGGVARIGRLLVAIIGPALLLAAGGCAKIVVKSTPPGATILYSDNGLPPWKPWRSEDGKDKTPSTAYVWGGTMRFFRAEMDGYFPTQPQLVDAFMFNIDKIDFDLTPSPEQIALEKKAQGLIYWEPEDRWVDPREYGLVEYNGEWMAPEEKFRREQIDAGLVEFEGRWVSPEERDRLFAEAQRAAGNVLYQGRWITPDEQKEALVIERVIEEAFSRETGALPPAESILQPRSVNMVLRFLNGTNSPVTVYFSGPESFTLEVKSFEWVSHEIAPGTYRIAAVPQNEELPVQTSTEEFQDFSAQDRGVVYSMSYQGEPGSLLEKVRSEDEIDLQLPRIDIPEIPTRPAPQGTGAMEMSEEERARVQEIMGRVRAGELTMEEAMQQLPESMRQRMQEGGMGAMFGGGRGGGPGGAGGAEAGFRGEGGGEGRPRGEGGPPGEGRGGRGSRGGAQEGGAAPESAPAP